MDKNSSLIFSGKGIAINAAWIFLMGASSCQSSKPTDSGREDERPNIIVMLVDDAGYADFGFIGSEDLQTPHIDRLAKNGVLFTNAYVTATVCGPSRAGLITGRYQQRFGFECNPSGNFTGLDLEEETIGDAMQKAGYVTAAFGKWHLGNDPEYRPNKRGFDYFWGFLSGSRNYFSNKIQDQPGHTHSIRENDTFTEFDGYLTDRLSDKTIEFIDRNKDQPFFIYWSPNAVHTPMEATEADLALFEGHPRQLLAAMTWSLDRAVGNIAGKLQQENLLDNTIIFFLSDNGGAHNNQSSNEPFKGFKGNKYEGGMRVPFFMHWPAQVEGDRLFEGITSALDIFATSIDAAGMSGESANTLDGVSLLPYLKGEKSGNPHESLFWRKDGMAAVRVGDYKAIRVERLGWRCYNLAENLGETENLADAEKDTFASLEQQLKAWEAGMAEPLWTEGRTWDTITWMIHEDLYNNQEVRVKEPEELARYRSTR